MRFFNVHFGYIYDSDKEKAITKQQNRILKLQMMNVQGIDLIDEKFMSDFDLVLNEQQLLDCHLATLEFKVKQEITMESESVKKLEELDRLVDRVYKLVDKICTAPAKELAYNETVEVHVPGPSLLTYNETSLLEDACTDKLQSQLDSGWRIIAACPQSQRRPDYILGRYNPERQMVTFANRGSSR